MNLDTLDVRMSRIVEKYPDKIAIEYGKEKISYNQLEMNTNKIANFLIPRYISTKNVVVLLENSSMLVESMIGIIKSGGIFIPIDYGNTDNRIIEILKQINIEYLITSTKLLGKVEKILKQMESEVNILLVYKHELIQHNVVNLNTKDNFVSKGNDKNIYNKHCYIYFTSGTTGKPKGILGRHKSLMHFIQWEIDELNADEKIRVSQLTNPSFDPFLRETLLPICVGGTLCIPEDREIIYSCNKLIEWLYNNHISIMHTVPSIFRMISTQNNMSNMLDNLEYMLLAGEILRGNDIKRFFESYKSKVQLINLYGPTETTLAKTYYRIKKEDMRKLIIPVGKPISLCEIYILNRELQKCDKGVVGEIYIRTPFITSGYINDKELTKKVFIKNPFTQNPQDIIYKTGDLGRMLENNNLELLGRVDDQVKIRGIRIEIKEIENKLLAISSISDAIVLSKEDNDKNKYLISYIVSHVKLNMSELRNCLRQSLPEYMIPTYIVQLDKIPLTSNGKLDKRALPEPNMEENLQKYESPRNDVEEKLITIWQEVLGINKIGINDNFFDLGGHSLRATIIISKIHKELGTKLQIKELFSSPTIKDISKLISMSAENSYLKIDKVEEKEYYETSSAQKRMYVLQQFDRESTAYNMSLILEIKGKFNEEKIEKTFRELSERHESLRTYFEVIEGEIVQKVDNEHVFKLKNRKDNRSIEEIVVSFVRPFDLGKAPLFRVELIENKSRTYLLIDMHHIISDGVSLGILIREFSKIYEGKKLNPLKLQYKDFAAWQNAFIKSEKMKEQEEYWVNSFSGGIPVLNLPYDYERPVVQSFEGDIVGFEIDEETTKKIRKLAKETESTMYMVLLSVFNILLSKYSGQEDVVVGTPIAGRAHADIQNVIGMFVNTLALRNKPEGNKKYIDFLKEVKENSLKAYENQGYQLETLIDKLNIVRDTSRNPLFDVMFSMNNTESTNAGIDGLLFEQYDSGNKISKFDLRLDTSETQTGIQFSVEYCTKLFNRNTINRFASHYKQIISSIVRNVQIKISEIDMLTEEERNKILYEFNNTETDYPKDKTIQELFEEQVKKTPDNVAIVYENKKLTYRELNEKSNQLARTLREKGVKADSIVGIMVERSLEMIIGIMGILKAGGAYLPIDPVYPKERIGYILEDSKARLLLSSENLMGNIKFEGEIIDLFNNNIYDENTNNLESISEANNLVYVIYTSGTTGNPKGVLIEHRNVVNFIFAISGSLQIHDSESVLALTTVSFDIFFLETLFPLINGLKVMIASDELQKDLSKLNKFIYEKNISIIQATPSRIQLLCRNDNKLSSLKKVGKLLVGGENLSLKLFERLKKLKINDLYNMYGPTETTIWSSIKRLTNSNTVNIGKPIQNTKIYILNSKNELLPIGIAGEICISGAGLARGYLNRPELTEEKFVDNPFEPGTKMYRTGDLAMWLPDGSIKFLGRIDNQVKIRGYRIELGEIESILLNYEYIKEAAVIARENGNGDKYLCSYLVGEKEIDKVKIKNYLRRTLPEYMIPSYFMQIEKMPLTPNGKLDRRALPEPKLEVNLSNYEAPRNEIEEKLVSIWEEILMVERVGINDNFFDLGGNSLKLISMISRIKQILNLDFDVKEIFSVENNIKNLSETILKSDVTYGIKYEDYTSTYLNIWNKDLSQKIFVFPPLGGYGFVYKELAEMLNSSSLYNFNFIESNICEDRIKKYIDIMTNINGKEPYVLMGYSAGGNLAFEVAKKLEANGYIVSNIIMIDSYKSEKKNNIDIEKETDEIIEDLKKEYNIEGEFNIEYLEGNIKNKLRESIDYHEHLENYGKLDCDIHLIIAKELDEEEQLIKNKKAGEWRELTNKSLIQYYGKGEHLEMLKDGNLIENAKIINDILRKI